MRILLVSALIIGLTFSVTAGARGTYQEPRAFIAETFGGDPPPPRVLWLTEALRAQVRGVMGRDLGVLRLRYWSRDARSAWILEEIGKEEPITTGVVVAEGRIEQLKVLVFRESRGWEVRYPFFTDQFRGATLDGAGRLDRPIDGISGATLSVRALDKVARLALLLATHAADRADGRQLSQAR